MLTTIREQKQALQKLLPLYEKQRRELELRKSLNEYEDYMEKIKQQNNQLEEYAQKTEEFRQQIENQKTEIENYKEQLVEKEGLIYELQEQNKSQIEYQKKEIENYKKQLKKMTEEKEKLINGMQNQNKSNFWESFFGRKNKIEKEEVRKQMLEPFLNQKNFEITKNSTVIMDGLGNRLFKREGGDSDECEPPLKNVDSLERRRKEVIDYIELERINWSNICLGTYIQHIIHNWFYSNARQFLYTPSEEEKENSRKMFLNKFKLRNTIGTIHFLPVQFSDRRIYFCFAISNYRIVGWAIEVFPESANSISNNILKELPTLPDNSKFATEMEVNDEQSDTFIHTSNKNVFVENEKVVTWIKNNSNLKQQNNTFTFFTVNLEQQNNFYRSYIYNIPSLYNFFVNFYDPSSI